MPKAPRKVKHHPLAKISVLKMVEKAIRELAEMSPAKKIGKKKIRYSEKKKKAA